MSAKKIILLAAAVALVFSVSVPVSAQDNGTGELEEFLLSTLMELLNDSYDYGDTLTVGEIHGVLLETASDVDWEGAEVTEVDWYGYGLGVPGDEWDGYQTGKTYYAFYYQPDEDDRDKFALIQIYDLSNYPDYFLSQMVAETNKRNYIKTICNQAIEWEYSPEEQTFDLRQMQGIDVCHMHLDKFSQSDELGFPWRSVDMHEAIVGKYYVLVVCDITWFEAEEPGEVAFDTEPLAKATIKNLLDATGYNPSQSTTTTTMPPSALTGKITDGHGNPMPYLKLAVSFDGLDYSGATAVDGSYNIQINDFIPDEKNPKDVTLEVEFSYERGGRNYYNIIDESIGGDNAGDLVKIQKTFQLKTEADTIQDIDFDLTTEPGISSSSAIEDLKHLAPIYYHTHEALDFMLVELKANVNYKLPVDIWVGGDDGTYYSSAHGLISIDEDDAHYDSSNRPDNREYHEFCHHLMAAEYNGFLEYQPGGKNHGGFINPTTADSYVEGFAEFMAMAISEYHADPNPEIYAGFGSFEMNYNPWAWKGTTEEIAVAGILWDLYDKNNEDGDDITLTLDEMWGVLKVKRKDFYEYYEAFKSAYPDKKTAIDHVYIKHGFFADTTVGNKKRDSFEPYRDGNNNSAYDEGEHYVDYGMPPQGILRYTFPYWMVYDEGEDIGRASNYHRENRSMAVMIPNAFIKVSDTEVSRYKVFVHYNNPQEGVDYEYGVDVREGVIYLMPPPEDVNVTITVIPDSQDYVASDVYVITTQQYVEEYYSAPEDQGYFDSHTFNLKPTGKKLDKPYETFHDGRPSYLTDRGYMVTGEKGDGDGGFCCLPLLPAVLALFSAIVAGIGRPF